MESENNEIETNLYHDAAILDNYLIDKCDSDLEARYMVLPSLWQYRKGPS